MDESQYQGLARKLDRIIELLECIYQHDTEPSEPIDYDDIVQKMTQAAIEERAKYDQAMRSGQSKQ